MRLFLACLALLLVAVTRPASAYFRSDFQNCSEPPTPKAAIEACGRLIRSGRLGRYALAFAHFNRGFAFEYVGRYRKALRHFDKAWDIDSDDVNTLINRGAMKLRLGEYRDAARDFRKATRQDEGNARAYLGRAYAADRWGRDERAQRYYRKAYALGERHPYLLRKLGR